VNHDVRGCVLIKVKRRIAMLMKEFFTEEEDGMLSTEMVVLIAAIGVLLTVGVGILFKAMSDFFGNWADFFNGTGS
jgi:Flp pilus assembly pilin Flp